MEYNKDIKKINTINKNNTIIIIIIKRFKRELENSRLILETELNARNKIIGINTLAIPVINYSFNIINWKLSLAICKIYCDDDVSINCCLI